MYVSQYHLYILYILLRVFFRFLMKLLRHDGTFRILNEIYPNFNQQPNRSRLLRILFLKLRMLNFRFLCINLNLTFGKLVFFLFFKFIIDIKICLIFACLIRLIVQFNQMLINLFVYLKKSYIFV